MAPLRISRPRFLAYLLWEGGLVFLVLYGLATLTSFLDRELGEVAARPMLATVAAVAGLFSVVLIITQWANPGDRVTLRRQVVLFGVISFTLSIFSFVALVVAFGDLAETLKQLPAVLILEGAIAVPLTIAVWRWVSIRLDVLNAIRERVLIVGTSESAQQLCRQIITSHPSEFAVVGFADERDDRLGTVLTMGTRVQTDYASLTSFAPRRVDRVIVALEEKRGKLPVRALMELRLLGVDIEESTTFLERMSGKIAVETMLPSWLVYSEGFKTSRLKALLKRFADVVFAAALLIVASPLMLLTALAVAVDTGFPIFYRQRRMGRDGNEFMLLKFRSMLRDAERHSGPTWAQKFDPRVTRVGSVIRATRIDELPQLFNVLRGEMSFVGPRPERRHFAERLEREIPYYGLRFTVRPGITGWAQVEYGYGATIEDALEKLKYELYYIKNSNLLLDLWIIMKTVKVVLTRRGAR